MLRVAFYNSIADMGPYIRKGLKGYSLSIHAEPASARTIDERADVLGIFLDTPVTAEMMKKMPRLKLVATMSTGFDHIDLAEAARRGITVCNVPTYGENTVAEHAMALILALSRRLFHSVKRVKEGVFDYHDLTGFDLKGKTVGVVGVGHIGLHLIQMLRGFETRIIASDHSPHLSWQKKYGFRYVPLGTLLRESDIISLHVPLLPSTYHLINKKNIRSVKKGAYIVNTARGALIDPEALVSGLESDRIAGAGLDVLENEPFVQSPAAVLKESRTVPKKQQAHNDRAALFNNILIDHPRVIVTPHNAFNSVEAIERILDTTTQNIKAFAAGKPVNVVGTK